MKKQLFKKASMQEIKQSSTVGSRFVDAKYSYINGYYKAGESLVATATNAQYSNDKDTLFYPICFNYRHYTSLNCCLNY